MRFARTAVLVAVVVAFVLLGPVVLLLGLLLLLSGRVRGWLRPTRRVVLVAAVVLLALVLVAGAVPDGRVPLPPGSGHLVTPRYVGRPANAVPVQPVVAQHPGPGPLGDSTEVRTAWSGAEDCAAVVVDGGGRPVTACRDGAQVVLRVLDPDDLRPLATKELPGSDACPEPVVLLDRRGRVVTATSDRRLVAVATEDAAGEPDLTTAATVDLSGVVAEGDCVVGLAEDPQGRTWWVTGSGRVGVAAADGTVGATDLGEQVTNALTAGEDGVYVVTVEALHKVVLDGSGAPAVRWRTAYDRGTEQKPGQLARGSGTAPTVLPGGLVAIADNADRRMRVVYLTAANGREVCRAEVFEEERGATEAALVPVADDAVLVTNQHGRTAAWRTFLGRTGAPGLARVEVAEDECEVAWTSDEAAPGPAPTFSSATGLVYAYTKPHSWWGVDASYLTALDSRTGRRIFAVRAGLGPWAVGGRSAVTLGPDGTAYVPVVGGLVAVRDRRPGS